MEDEIWITYEAKEWLDNWLKPHMNGVEFGSGGSTIWLAKRVKQLISVEHNKTYLERVKRRLIKEEITNVRQAYKFRAVRYIETAMRFRRKVDFAFIDGLERLECIAMIRDKVKEDGIIIVDNTDRPYWGEARTLLCGWEHLIFKGEGSGGTWETSIFKKVKQDD